MIQSPDNLSSASSEIPSSVLPAATPSQTDPASSKPLNNLKSFIISILLLLFLTPIGLIYMWWVKTTWKLWIKILITVFSVIFVIIPGTLVILALIFINPVGMYNRAKDADQKSREIKQKTIEEVNKINQEGKSSFPTATVILTPAIKKQANGKVVILQPVLTSLSDQAQGELEIKGEKKDTASNSVFVTYSGTLANLLPQRIYNIIVCAKTDCQQLKGTFILTDEKGNAIIPERVGKIENVTVNQSLEIKIVEEMIDPNAPQSPNCYDAITPCLSGWYILSF